MKKKKKRLACTWTYKQQQKKNLTRILYFRRGAGPQLVDDRATQRKVSLNAVRTELSQNAVAAHRLLCTQCTCVLSRLHRPLIRRSHPISRARGGRSCRSKWRAPPASCSADRMTSSGGTGEAHSLCHAKR